MKTGVRAMAAAFGALVLGASSAPLVREPPDERPRVCSREDGIAALAVVDYLSSWREIRDAFEQFGHCLDGAIAQGFSEAVARQLVDHPGRFPEVARIIAKEPLFEPFVLRSINATLDPKDLSSVERLATTKCPSRARRLCAKMASEARAALQEQREITKEAVK